MNLELLKTRRSIRKYQDREIESEKLDTLIKSALLAPTSGNRKSWEFIVIQDRSMLKKLSQSKHPNPSFLADASAAIVVIGSAEICDVWTEDAAIAATILHLTAHSMGLGSCWIQIRGRLCENEMKSEDYVKEALGIPSKYNVDCIMALGYPAEEKAAYTEDDLRFDKVHYEVF